MKEVHSAALYIHMPWCIKKCPYCDFNSHVSAQGFPEADYIAALIQDFKEDIQRFGQKTIRSIFIGGGTPSLFSAESYHDLFMQLRNLAPFSDSLEITLEANPGSFEQNKFSGYLTAGINRLSLGIQSFQPDILKKLGRIHDEKEALSAILTAQHIGFTNINIDLMYGSPQQSAQQALMDLKIALDFKPTHLSWYQFTLEPNTYFYRHPPKLPNEDEIAEMERVGLDFLFETGYRRYEISAFEQGNKPCQHNLTYWTFGDYYGIGAGAHGKLTDPQTAQIVRTQKHRLPQQYLNRCKPFLVEQKYLTADDKCFEFILNVSRLEGRIPIQWFEQQTGLAPEVLHPFLHKATQKGLIEMTPEYWHVTSLGRRFTNDLQQLALPV